MPDAPRFPYPVWAVWRDDLDPAVAKIALKTLRELAIIADKQKLEILNRLRDISETQSLETLGDPDV